jgi:hypothetical protein
MAARLTNLKLGKLFEGDADTISDVEKALSLVNIKIRDTENSFRPMGQVFNEIAQKWGTLNDLEKSAISGAVAGIRQRESFITLMENYNQVLEAQEIALNSAGLATERYQTYLDSAEAAANKFTATWEKLASKVINSDFLIWTINFGTSLLEIIDNLGVLTIALSALATKGLIVGVVSQYTLAIQYLSKILLGATVSATALNVAIGAITFVAIAASLYGIIQLVKKAHVSMSDLKDDFDNLSDTTSSNLDELDNLAKRYEVLALKTEKSREDQLELIDVVSTLNTKYGMIVDNVDLYSDAIGNNTKAIYENIEAIKAQKLEEANNFYASEKAAYEQSKKFLDDIPEKWSINTEKMVGYKDSEIWDTEKFNAWTDTYTATAQEMLQIYADMAGQEGIKGGYWTRQYEQLLADIDAAQSLVEEYELFVDVLKEAAEWQGVSTKKEGISNFWSEKSWSEGSKYAGEATESNYNFVDSVKALSGEIQSATSIYQDYIDSQELSSDQILNIIENYDNYAELLTIENGKITLNTQALKDNTVQKIEDALATAILQRKEGEYNAELEKQISILDALKTQVIADFDAIAEARAKETAEAAKAQVAEIQAKAAEIKEQAYQDLLQITINMLRQKKQAEIDALQAQLDSYKAIIDAEKELIEQKEKERDYDKEKAERNEKIANIEAELAEAQFDTSEEGIARKLDLEEKLKEEKEGLDELEHDRSIELQEDALDTEYEKYEKIINKKIKKLEQYLEETGTITQDAIALLSSRSDEFYQSLIEWNRQFGSGVDEDIVGAWQRAFNAMVAYAQAAQQLGVGDGITIGNLDDEGTGDQGDLSGERVKINSKDGDMVTGYQTSSGIAVETQLKEGRYYTVAEYKSGAKAAYRIKGYDEDNNPIDTWIKSKNIVFETFHEGLEKGVVGGKSDKYGEVFANLLKGEYVINPQQIKDYVTTIFPKSVNAIVKGNNGGEIKMGDFMPMIIQGNLDSSVLPEVKKMISEGLKEFDHTLKKRGIFRSAKNYSL